MKRLMIILSLLLIASKSYSQEYGWKNIGHLLPDTVGTATISDIAVIGDSIWITSGYANYFNGATGEIYFSSDSGKTFSIQNTKYGTHAIHMIDAQNGWCGGAEGQIYNTTDGGTTWERKTFGFGSTVMDIDFPENCHTGLVTGFGGNVKMITPESPTTGLVSVYMYGYVSNIYSVSCIDSVHAFVAGEEIIGPVTRGVFMVDQTYPGTNGIYAIDMVDTLYGWCVGSPTAAGAWDSSGCMIIRTVDGHVWEEQVNPVKCKNGTLMAIKALNKLEAWTVGTSGVILHTSDGGITWKREAEGLTNEMLYGIWVVNNKEVYVTGNNRTLLKYGLLSASNNGENTETQRKMEIYPIPAKEFIHLRPNSNEDIQFINIFDLQGKLLFTHYNTIKPEINVSILPKGIYILEVKTDKNKYVVKVIKE